VRPLLTCRNLPEAKGVRCFFRTLPDEAGLLSRGVVQELRHWRCDLLAREFLSRRLFFIAASMTFDPVSGISFLHPGRTVGITKDRPFFTSRALVSTDRMLPPLEPPAKNFGGKLFSSSFLTPTPPPSTHTVRSGFFPSASQRFLFLSLPGPVRAGTRPETRIRDCLSFPAERTR